MKVFKLDEPEEKQPSLLERMARKIEPTDKELKDADKLPDRSRVARMLKAAQNIPGIKHKLSNDLLGHRGPAKPVAAVKMLDNETMVYCDDGSLRHAAPHIKGKAARKAFKRAKRRGL